MVWCCPGNLREHDPAIADSQHLAWTATTGLIENPALWTRGLLGIQGLPEIPLPEEASYHVGTPADLEATLEVTFATDGSGVDGTDPSNRRCGWSWVAITTTGDLIYSSFGTLEGRKQTVFRAELTALNKLMLEAPHPSKVAVDNALVVRGARGRRHVTSRWRSRSMGRTLEHQSQVPAGTPWA